MAVRITLTTMTLGALLIVAGGLGLLAEGADLLGLGLMVSGALGAGVALDSTPRPVQQPVRVLRQPDRPVGK
jgi:hypothetical protein